MKELKHGQTIDVDKLIDPEVTLHSVIFGWRNKLTVDLALMESIKEGQLQPIIFRKKKDKHELLIGARRYFHQKLLGTPFEDIPKEIKEKVTERDALLMAASENVFREDFSPFEEARVISDLVNTAKIKPKALAKKFNRSESYIRSRMALMKLPEKTRKFFENKGIAMSYAPVVMKLKGEAQQELLEQIERGMSNSYGGISSVESAEKHVNEVLKTVKEKEDLLKKYGACPKCQSVNIASGWNDENRLNCKDCNHSWHGVTREPWKLYELKQAAEQAGIEVVEVGGKIELTPRDVADLMKKKEREEEILREAEPEVEKIPENFRSEIALDSILIPIIRDNLQKITVKGSTIEVELIEDSELYFKGLKKNYKDGQLARIETLYAWDGNMQQAAKRVHAHIKKATGE